MDLHDKVIVVTGASSGFGEQIARRCSRAGARVVLAARSAERLQRLADELGAGAGRALAVVADVTSDADVDRLVAETHARFGHADVVVANAGFGVMDPIASARLADLQEMVEVNLYGAVRVVQAFLPDMLRRRSGQIVIMSSLAGLVATQRMGFYVATKHALVGVARSLMIELYGSGVRCALICPGVARTGFQRRADEHKYARITRWVSCDSAQVAEATARAIRRHTHGDVIVPWYGRALVTLSNLIPVLPRLVIRALG